MSEQEDVKRIGSDFLSRDDILLFAAAPLLAKALRKIVKEGERVIEGGDSWEAGHEACGRKLAAIARNALCRAGIEP